MLKKKSKSKSNGPTCTSTASSGALKCLVEGEHTTHCSSATKRGQYATWSLAPDGRMHVLTYLNGKKQGDGWYEAAPKVMATSGHGVQGDPAPSSAASEAGSTVVMKQTTGRHLDPPTCSESMAGIACTLPEGHEGSHVGEGGEWTPDRVSARFDEAPEHDEREDDVVAIGFVDPAAVAALPDATIKRIGFEGEPEFKLEHEPRKSGVKVHPAADVFPMLEGDEYEALREDIRRNGVRVRPVIDEDGLLVDGRNRLRACEELGINVVFDRLPAGTDVIDFVISANLRRRHLNASQRSMFADAVANLRQGRPKETGSTAGLTQAQAASRFGVSERSVREARVVRENAVPEVVGAVEQGKLSVDAAAKLSKLPKEKQKAIYEREIKPKKDMVKGGKIKALTKQEEKREVVRKINTGRVEAMPTGEFGLIYVDYPWWYDNSDQHEGSRGHLSYPPMSMVEIMAHANEASARASRKGCIVALWVTNAYIHQVGLVLEAYGATQRTMWTWPKPKMGVGSWSRGQTEHLVIASIGTPTHTLNEVSTLLKPYALREHSRKPDEVAELLQKHCAGPFLELFAREPRKGWTTWGAEVEKFQGAA